MDFEKRLREELKELSKNQLRTFAWHCAVRVLPVLGHQGNFNLWKSEDVQKHLYSIFYSLDFKTNLAEQSTNIAIQSALYSAHDSTVTVHKIRHVIWVICTAFDYINNLAELYSIIYALGTFNHNYGTEVKFDHIFLHDIKNIKSKKVSQKSVETYGQIWDNFQLALKNEGCEYWGKLYKEIFEKNFELDQEKLEQRLNVPESVRAQGAAAVAEYLEDLERQGAENLNESRIIILGDKGAGKTCVARRLIDPEADMTTPKESTAGVDTLPWEPEGEDMKIRIWDFAGHTVTHAVHRFFLSERCLYIMVYDGRSEKRNQLDYWLDHMRNYGGRSRAIILVNERDDHKVNLPENRLKEEYRIEGFYAFNVQDDKEDLEAFRKDIVDYIKNNPSWRNQEIPSGYYKVKEELELLFDKEDKTKREELITKNKFQRIAKKHVGEKEEDLNKLLRNLHALGISLWYSQMAKYNTLVLNPEWISHGVYKIINWVNDEKLHSISLKGFLDVFEEEPNRFPEEKHDFLFDLIKHYELAYESKIGRRRELIIPHLLPIDQPADLPEFDNEKSLFLRYESSQVFPPNVVSRFIVRHNEQIKKKNRKPLAWKDGVILTDGKDGLALVREMKNVISISVTGADMTAFFSSLRATMNDIFDSYESQNPTKRYRLARPIEYADFNLWLREEVIINHVRNGKDYYDSFRNLDIPMLPMKDIYDI